MTLDTQFAAGMREQLIDTAAGTSPLAIHTRRVRIGVRAVSVVGAIALLTGGALIAASVIPGAHIITDVGEPITQSHVGNATVELGARPDEANAVSFVLTCTSAGLISFAESSTISTFMFCGPEGTSDPRDPMGDTVAPLGTTATFRDVLLEPGVTSFDVTADPGMSWTVTARYVHTETTEWGVNAKGETYGTSNENGVPDLEAVYASNCEIGYIYSNHLSPADPDGTLAIPVYESDGVSVIGEFWIGSNAPFCENQ